MKKTLKTEEEKFSRSENVFILNHLKLTIMKNIYLQGFEIINQIILKRACFVTTVFIFQREVLHPQTLSFVVPVNVYQVCCVNNHPESMRIDKEHSLRMVGSIRYGQRRLVKDPLRRLPLLQQKEKNRCLSIFVK